MKKVEPAKPKMVAWRGRFPWASEQERRYEKAVWLLRRWLNSPSFDSETILRREVRNFFKEIDHEEA